MATTIDIVLAPHEVFQIGGVSITDTMISAASVTVVILLFCLLLARKFSLHPFNKLQVFFEYLFMSAYSFVEQTLENKKVAKKVFPLLMTIFLFIFASAFFNLLPIIGDLEVYKQSETFHLFRPVGTDFNFTFVLAVIVFIMIEFLGIATLGFFRYFKRFFNLSSPMGFVVGIIELISEVIRLVSFSFRLFGNMFAGKALILVVSFFVPLLLPIPIILYEVFVGFIQGAIFALLTLFFIKIAITSTDDH